MLGVLGGAALRSLLLAAVVGAALRLRRAHNPLVSFAAWTLVLAASLSMPLAIRVSSSALPDGIIKVPMLPVPTDWSHVEQWVSAVSPAGLDWYWAASLLYITVFSTLMLRLLAGLSRSWHVVRRAVPIREDWVGDINVRVSQHINAPATFGSVILLPADYTAWAAGKRLAVLAP